MTTRLLSRVGVLAGAVLAASAGFSGLAQAHTLAAPATSCLGMASPMHAAAADTHTEAMPMIMPMDPAAVHSAVAKGRCEAACATHAALGQSCTCCGQGASARTAEQEKCCAASPGASARAAEQCSCCAGSPAAQRMPARGDRSAGCCD
ncbi:hypothetical protein GCM10010095_21720 [Streptomyces anthocyanicus]|uniref:hypothetical protein n=1 Tax=Streptomyces anthocyanicus TaxID=68174 RepID=UPI0016714786|nr:hypothetical protein [Streptomyces anthocyanicus]GGL36126.1 hypothetical protein GCM10010095_21720 [Streptomyces anthocyanicus]